MALYENSGSDIVMPVQPMGNYGNNGGGMFGMNGEGMFYYMFMFFFFLMFGGWGNGFGNGFGGNNGAMPYMMSQTTNNDVQHGFDQQAIMGGINGINNSLAQAEVSRCNGVYGITNAINSGFTGVQTSLANNQMGLYQAMNNANMTQMQNTNTLAASLQNCCCENRAGLADLKYSIATEACSDRQAVNDGVRDLMAATTANTKPRCFSECPDKPDR